MLNELIRRSTTVILLVFCVVVFGLKTYSGLPREASPDVEIPVVLVSTPYIGVSPEDIEGLVTIPLENELSSLTDVKKMSSTSAEGASIITLEFSPSVVIEDALQRVRDRVSRVRPDLPDDVLETEVTEISFSEFPILILTVAGPVDETVLKDLGESLAEDIRQDGGVLDAVLTGGRERQIRVQVDPYRLQHYQLSLDDVLAAIASENVNIPGGDLRVGSASFLLRVPGEFSMASEIENVAVKRVGDRPVFVRDLARVMDVHEDRESYARMNGEAAVSIAISKRTGANILEVANRAKAEAARHKKGWPKGVRFRSLGDQSKFVQDMVSELENGIMTALILVVGVILFSMGVRNSLFVAAAIPLSMFLAMLAIWAFGMTLNMIVLFSLILALGMLVDNAIVLVENIYRHVELGENAVTAAVRGTKEVAGAVLASTATTVAAFFPLLFWEGVMGQFMGYMPKTVIIVLLSSLVVAVVALPVFCAKLMKRRADPVKEARSGRVIFFYRRVLEWSIDHRYRSLLAGTLALIGSFVAYGFWNHGTEFFAETEPNRATITVRAPDGTDLDATDLVVRQVEAILSEEPNVDIFVAETGLSGGGDPMAGAQAAPHLARITVEFPADDNTRVAGEKARVEPTSQTVDRIRARAVDIPGAKISVEKERMGPPVGKPISVEVSGKDFDEVGAFALAVRRSLASVEGVTDLSDDYRVGRPEMRLRIKRGAAKRVGVSTRDIGRTVRTAVAGAEASKLRDGDDEYDILVELAPEFRDDLESVLSMRVPGSNDNAIGSFFVPLSSVANFALVGGRGAIRHIDQDLVVTIEGDVAEGYNQNEVRGRVERRLEEINTPAGFRARLGGADDEQRDAQVFLANAFLVALCLIALVLVTEFNRLDLPLVVLASVIMSLMGVLWGLIITKTSFGIMMTGLGIISLAGVVVNNAIVLLDYVEQLVARGESKREALIAAGLTRFRPVMLTAVTTMLGLIPMAVGVSFDFRRFRWIVGSQSADWWGPMAVAVIFGLMVATVLTLVLVPTMYSVLDDIRGRIQRLRGARGRVAPS